MAIPNAARPERDSNPSCFGEINNVGDQVRDAAQRVEHIVARLCGSMPVEPANPNGTPAITPNGLLDEATDRARDIARSVARINAALDRLESRLP